MIFKRTSIMHRDIGEHTHEMVIYDSYETYAVCSKCGMHDWSTPKGYQGDVSLVPYFQQKYPDAIVERLV